MPYFSICFHIEFILKYFFITQSVFIQLILRIIEFIDWSFKIINKECIQVIALEFSSVIVFRMEKFRLSLFNYPQ